MMRLVQCLLGRAEPGHGCDERTAREEDVRIKQDGWQES